MLAWWCSLICNLVQSVRQYGQATTQLQYYVSMGRTNPEKKEAFSEQFKAAKQQRLDAMLNIIKSLGDLTTATKGSGKTFVSKLRTERDIWSNLLERLLVRSWWIDICPRLPIPDLQVTNLSMNMHLNLLLTSTKNSLLVVLATAGGQFIHYLRTSVHSSR